MTTSLRVILFCLVFAGGAAIYINWPATSAKKMTGPMSVEVMPIHPQPVQNVIDALGTAQANESIDITASISETLAEVAFVDGQRVEKDTVIVRLEQKEEQAQLEAAKIQLAEHERELRRLSGLLKERAAAQRDVDSRQTQLRITKKNIEEITARIEDRTLRAPFAGRVGVRRLSEGALVQPGQVITTLDDTSQIKLDFTVPETALPFVSEGMSITARSTIYPDEIFEGILRTIDTRIDPMSRSLSVRALLPNEAGKIHPGMLLRVSIELPERSTLMAPEEAILQRKNKAFVLLVDDESVVQEREVTLGLRRDGLVELRTGVSEGEKLVVRGVVAVRNGMKVDVAKAWDMP